ncbi:MAG: hypothetical protein JWP14_2519 [Frankiales bacterium]|nr:hypothetical protein [Frankiales bacterium]
MTAKVPPESTVTRVVEPVDDRKSTKPPSMEILLPGDGPPKAVNVPRTFEPVPGAVDVADGVGGGAPWEPPVVHAVARARTHTPRLIDMSRSMTGFPLTSIADSGERLFSGGAAARTKPSGLGAERRTMPDLLAPERRTSGHWVRR